MQTVTVVAAAVLLWSSSAAARRSTATQAVIGQCATLGAVPMPRTDVYIYDELFHVAKNPFLWKDYEPIPFDKMHPSLLLSAACELVQNLHAGLDELESETTATWCKVVQPLGMLYDGYERVTNVFEFLTTVNHTVEMEVAVSQGMALARGFPRRLLQSTALYALLRKIRFQQTSESEPSYQQLRVLDHWIAQMNERGINFATDAAKMATFRRLDDEEAELKRKFVNNVRQGTAAFHLTLRDGQHLRGVPHYTLAAMAAAAQQRNLTYSTGLSGAIRPPTSAPPLDGAAPTPEWGPWTVTFDPFVYESMMAYCPARRIRQLIYQSYENRASQKPWNNVPVVERILKVRHIRANLLDSASYADLVGRRRMASLHRANEFLDAILAPVASAALRTLVQIVRLMADSEARGEDVWDNRYVANYLDYFSATGQRLATDQNSLVTVPMEMMMAYVIKFPTTDLRPYGVPPIPPPPKINIGSLERAERYMINNTLSQPGCVALLAKVTPSLRNWDIPYWGRRLESTMEFLNNTNAGSPPENLSTFLTLSRALSGAFGLLSRLWGVHAVEIVNNKPPVWHPEVKYFQLFNGTNLLGSFFFDPFARTNKLSSPFTRILVKRSEAHAYLPGKDRTPVVVMSTNIKAPGPGEPALLQINDVLAVFHELGHVFQNLADQNDEVLIPGTATLPLDFSEMFGQFYELWATEECVQWLWKRQDVVLGKRALINVSLSTRVQPHPADDCRKLQDTRFADSRQAQGTGKRYETLVRRMARCARRPIKMIEQLYMSKLDLSFHSVYKANATQTIFTHRRQVAENTLILPHSSFNCDFCTNVQSFEHGSVYYSHLWSDMHASDAMGYFEEVGVLNDTQVRALGDKMATGLLSGAQDDASAQYEVKSASFVHLSTHEFRSTNHVSLVALQKFRGRPASTDALKAHLA